MAELRELQPGQVFAGDYRIVRRLGEGGMGAVYVVEQLSTSAERALKLMRPEIVQDPEMRRRFEQEAKVSARIRSDHVVKVLAAGVDAPTGAPFLAMELLEGAPLSDVMRRGPLPLAEVREIASQLCHALGAAHQAGVVHRDLKPENIFLAPAQRAGVAYTVKVLDFGIAKVVAESMTRTTAPIGTPLWMAPEQTTQGSSIGPGTDLWALGLIVFHMLTGRYFWRSADGETSPVALLREVVLDPMPAASQRAAELGCAHLLPHVFDAWFARCVARDPQVRFRDAAEALAALPEGSPSPGAIHYMPTAVPAGFERPLPPPVPFAAFPPGGGWQDPRRPPKQATGGAAWLLAGTAGLIFVAAAVGGIIALGSSLSSGFGRDENGEAPNQPLPAVTAPSEPPAVASPPIDRPRPQSQQQGVATAPVPVPTIAPPPTAPVPTVPFPTGGGSTRREFDRGAASAALSSAAASAKSCKKPDGPTGSSTVNVTFAPSGAVTSATVAAPFAGTAVGSCVASVFRGARVPPFDGPSSVNVSKSFSIN